MRIFEIDFLAFVILVDINTVKVLRADAYISSNGLMMSLLMMSLSIGYS